MRYVLPLEELTLDRIPQVGGKNASLGELLRSLEGAGVRVPGGFALTVEAYRRHLEQADLLEAVHSELERLDVEDLEALARVAGSIRARIEAASLPEDVAAEVREAYLALCRSAGEEELDVAVRSSATAEDLPTASFAGQQESFLGVRGVEQLLHAVRACMASLFTDRAITYRHQQGIAHRDVSLSVGVQRMVRSDLGCSGVLFTLDTETGWRDLVLINAAWGLGEPVVQGRVDPDEYRVHKPTLAAGHRPILRRVVGGKALRMVYGPHGGCVEEAVPEADRRRPCLDDDEVLELARMGMAIERHYSALAGRDVPMDVEWARDGRTGELFVLQARPETVHARSGANLELFRLEARAEPLVRGRSVGGRIAGGRVSLVRGPEDLASFAPGDVLVAELTDPDWEPILRRASAVVTDHGGRTCHAAIVSRELGLPCVVGTGDATRVLRSGQEVTVSCAEGEEGRVYPGLLPFTREEVDPASLPEPPVPLMLNLADPDLASSLAALPCAGVGLMRIEFLVSNWIGLHPMALVHPERLEPEERAEVERLTQGASDPRAFFVERLASGIALVAAAFWPRPVIVRFSDFKTNEYRGLVGGRPFEPEEENPMIGFRGASRYHDERYREGFGLECRAVREVRETMGLTNVQVMVPFCRTLKEGRAVLAEMERHGLVRGRDGLRVLVMCEIPNNVVLAEEFSELFDGFSIGSNDLTQLTLGVDRDSRLLAEVFDERDPGVKRMISMVVEKAHRCGRSVGICGQAPSDYPDFAAFLVELGIDSISLNPDSLLPVTRRLALG